MQLLPIFHIDLHYLSRFAATTWQIFRSVYTLIKEQEQEKLSLLLL